MTIQSSGNVLIGGTSARASAKLDILGDVLVLGSNSSYYATIDYSAGLGLLSIAAETGGNIAFKAGTTLRATIDSSGAFNVGTASWLGGSTYQSGGLQFGGSTYANLTMQTGGTVRGQFLYDAANTYLLALNTGNFFVYNTSGGVYLSSGATSWTASSDERLKDIIEPITDAANKVNQLRAVIGKFKTDAEGTRRSFLIAQDVQAVLPEAVTESQSKDQDQAYLGVQYTDVIPLLVAAIKEQTAIIESLKARLDAANL
jgi:hypothetical protein